MTCYPNVARRAQRCEGDRSAAHGTHLGFGQERRAQQRQAGHGELEEEEEEEQEACVQARVCRRVCASARVQVCMCRRACVRTLYIVCSWGTVSARSLHRARTPHTHARTQLQVPLRHPRPRTIVVL